MDTYRDGTQLRQAVESRTSSILGVAVAALILLPPLAAADADWPVYLGDPGGTHYSALKEIDRSNVARLQPAWTFHTGDATQNSQIQCNPLVIGGVLYATSPQHKLFALDAATGTELWRFDPLARGDITGGRGVNRGLAFWSEGGERRLLYTASHFLHAVDPETGALIDSFGDHGRVDLLDGLDRDVHALFLVGTTPGAIYRDLIIVTTRVGEGPGPAAPGHICAYDVRTGKRRWIFHTIPWPGEFGHETWPPDAWKDVGGANCWGGITVDRDRGIAFVPTGSPAFDFWGGNRIGDNLFADCLLALDAATGRRLWHFQFVHHDLWDRDPPAPPVLCEVVRDGRRIAAVAQTTKSGHVWLFNRETGESLFPWSEQPVPASDLDGESASPTQPFPEKPAAFARQHFTEDEVTNLSEASRADVLARLRAAVPHRPFSPPSLRGTVILPGFDGGGEWGGAAVDPDGVLYVNGNEMAWILQMVPTHTGDANLGSSLYGQLCISCHGPDRRGNAAANIPSLVDVATRIKPEDAAQLLRTGRGVMPSFAFLTNAQRSALVDFLFGLKSHIAAIDAIANDAQRNPEMAGDLSNAFIPPYTSTGYNRFLDPDGYPALRPPWGTLNAIDLNTGEYRWRRPLGELPELTARGVPATGTENYGGPLVTAGGIVFIGATKDEKFRAFDSATGALLWETTLPAGGYAAPATYTAGGRQFVVLACGGGKMGTRSGDSYVAFALPVAAAGGSAGSAEGGRIRVKVLGADGRPLPARAWVRDAAGRQLFHPDESDGCTPYKQDRSFTCDGVFTMAAPAGSAIVHVERGKEFVPVEQRVAVEAGKTAEVTVQLRRWIDMAARGYFSADFHVHFGSDSPAVLRQLALADDLNVLPALTYWWNGKRKDLPSAWPVGYQHAAIDPAHFVTRSNLEIERIPGRSGVGDAMGAMLFLNLGALPPLPPFGQVAPSGVELAESVRRGSPGCVIDADKPSWPETPVGAALGVYDAVEVCHNHFERTTTLPGGWGMMGPLAPGERDLKDPDELFLRTNALYYRLLNCGIRLGVAGGSAMGVMPAPAGFNRTYAHVDGQLTPESFWAAVKAGRTFATSGPMLTLAIDGQQMGAEIALQSAEAKPLAVEVRLDALESVRAVELIANGEVIKSVVPAPPAPGAPVSLATSWPVPAPKRSTWYAARALYTAPDGRLRQAHTSPVYAIVDGRPIADDASAEYFVQWIDRLINAAQRSDHYAAPAEREALLATYRRAREVYRSVATGEGRLRDQGTQRVRDWRTGS